MASFDGLFLKETPCETNVDVALSESKAESVVSALSASICYLSNGSANYQDELDMIFGQDFSPKKKDSCHFFLKPPFFNVQTK